MSTTTKTAREQFLDDVITTAVEGGINYWAFVDEYTWSDDGPTSVIVIDTEEMRCATCDAVITDGRGVQEHFFNADPYFLTDEETEAADRAIETGEPYDGPKADHEHLPKGVLIDREKIEAAFATMLAGPIEGLHDSYRAQYIGAYGINDCGDLDAGDCDNILQIALFGKVVYG